MFLVLIVVGSLIPPAVVGAAMQTPTAELALLILQEPGPGFEPVEGVRGLPDGPVDIAELAALAPGGGEKLTEEERRSIQAYGRTWADKDDNLVIIILFKLPRLVDAQLFVAGVVSQMEAQFGGVSRFGVPNIPGATGHSFTPQPSSPPAHQIVFQKGTIATQVVWLPGGSPVPTSRAITVAERQAARLPVGSSEPTSGTDDSTSFGVELGGAIGVALLMLGIATLATRSARKKREAPKPPPVPGTPPVEEVRETVELADIRGLRRRSQVVLVLLGVSGALAVTSAIIDVGLIDRIQRIRSGQAVNFDTLTSLDDLHSAIAVAQVAALLVTGILWLMWQHRAQKILGRLQEEPLRFSPGAAAGWWLVPIANLVMPFRTMSELYRGSADPTSSTSRGAGPRLLLVIWWLMFVSTSILGRIVRTLDDSLDELVLQSRLLALIDLAYLFAAATAIGVVSLIFGGLKSRAAAEPPAPLATAEAPAGI